MYSFRAAEGVQVIQGNATSHTFYKPYNRTISSSSGKRTTKIRKVKKTKKTGVDDYDDDGSYEKVITKTEIKIRKKKRKKSKANDSEEYEEYEVEEEGENASSEMLFGATYSMYMVSDVAVKHQTPKSAACMTWCGNKVKTFDGLTYSHNLHCAHTLVQDIRDGSFSVVLKACAEDVAAEQCTFALQLFVGNVGYTLEKKNGFVRLFTADKELSLPIQMLGMRVNILGHNVKVQLEVIGLTILWDMNQLVTVEASAALFNRTGGLCGTLDQNPQNDFRSKNGAVTKTTATFVDSWQIQTNEANDKCGGTPDNQLEMQCEENVREAAEGVCEQLLSNGKFADCMKVFNKASVMESCISDYCFCSKSERSQCACDGLSVFAKDCQYRGIKLDQEWRDTEICPMKCKPGRIYKACGPSFEATCGSATADMHESCTEGCFCPDGFVQHEGECIQAEHCPCTLRGKTFKKGSEVRQDCNTCRCERGVWKCSDETCGARCGAIGDPHYRTFDGKLFDFMGKCSYYLLKRPNFSIEAENVACSGSLSEGTNFGSSGGADLPACTRSVTIKVVDNHDVTKVIKLKQGRQITVDGIEIQKLPIKILNGLIIVRQTSSIIVSVVFDDGLKVLWDGMTSVYIDAPPSYRDKTQGLCGTFNSNQQDDFLTPEGDVEPSVGAFANKWRTKDTCEYVSDSPDIPHPCQLNIENKEKALSVCAKLKSNVFDACAWYVDPEPYYENCMYDICACKGDLPKCLCTIFASYASECSRQGVTINWRHSVKECSKFVWNDNRSIEHFMSNSILFRS